MTKPKIVQFVHPGFEYQKREHVGPRHQRSGVMPWKDGGSIHDRKFMWHPGSAFDPSNGIDHADVPLTFWGEGEGPSVFWRIKSPGKPVASIVHAPFHPADVPTRPVPESGDVASPPVKPSAPLLADPVNDLVVPREAVEVGSEIVQHNLRRDDVAVSNGVLSAQGSRLGGDGVH